MVQKPHTSTEKILGIKWSPYEDQLCLEVKIEFSTKRKMTALANNAISEIPPQQLTKRMLLSQINSVYDPLGLAGPFTVGAKILMRHLWGSNRKLDWDDPIPEENKPQLPEIFKTAMASNIEAFQDTLAGRIDISKYSNYNKLLRVTARIMKLYDRNPKSSLKNATDDLTPDDVEKAELFWIREAQQNMGKDIENGKYK